MMLIEPLPADSNSEFTELFEFYKQAGGYLPTGMLMLLRRPEILTASIALHKAITAAYPNSRVTPELKGLLAHITSRASGCRYCQAHTALGSNKRGTTSERLDAIWEFRTSSLFTDAERAALELAVAAGVSPNAVTPEMREEARKHWTDDELVEIVAVIANMGFANRWNDTVATMLEDAPREFAEERLTRHGWEVGRHAAV
jgi:alkylhydroperoxidase family enzyme